MERAISRDQNLFKKLGPQVDLIQAPHSTTLWRTSQQGAGGNMGQGQYA